MTTTTTPNENTAHPEAPYDELKLQLRGGFIRPSDPGYDEARKVYNGMIDRYPAAIAECVDASDVASCVRFAAEHGIDLAVRGGGHNAGGLGVADGALVISLSRMRSVEVDPERRTVRAGGGCTLADIDGATAPYGMATPMGIMSTTGIGGLALGGGIGVLARRDGLTVDNLLAADVVLADGSQVTASADSYADLFWALRGGGGNFGVVTSFTFACHDVGREGIVIGGPVIYDLADAPDVMRWYREVLPSLPEELSGWLGLMTVPLSPLFPEELWNRKICVIIWCYTGDHENADAVLAPVKEFGSPLLVGLQELPYAVLQSMMDSIVPPGLHWYWKAHFFKEITDASIDVHLEHASVMPTMLASMHLYPIDGAAARVPETDTAFAHRNGGWAAVIGGVATDAADAPRASSWAQQYWRALQRHAAGGGYVNFLMPEGQDRVRASYKGNYDRLTGVKAAYDPRNLFHINQNIPPAA